MSYNVTLVGNKTLSEKLKGLIDEPVHKTRDILDIVEEIKKKQKRGFDDLEIDMMLRDLYKQSYLAVELDGSFLKQKPKKEN